MKLRWKYLIPWFRRAEERDMREELDALAEIAGRRELGNLTVAAENAREAWGWAWLDGLAADIRYAFRTLRRQRSFTVVAVVSLALGIGANAAIFSLMDALLWRDLPVREPDRLQTFVGGSRAFFAYSRFAESAGSVMENVIASSGTMMTHLDAGGGPERGQLEWVSGNFFGTLGVDAPVGRAITPGDDRRGAASLVAVLSHAYWQRVYGGRAVMGQTIRIEKTLFTIIGVAPPEFFGISVDDAPDVWLPVSAVDNLFPKWLDSRNVNFLTVVGRLRPGVTAQQAAEVLTPVSIQIEIERNGPPVNEKDRRNLFESKLKLESAAKGLSFLRDRFSKPLRVVFWMVAIGLLLACVNVMSLEFARADERRKELTVRLAIGAGRWRIARQLLTESMVVALASGLLGVAIRKPLADGVVRLIIVWRDQPAKLDLDIHPGVLFFVIGVSLAAALVAGVLPAMRATRGEVLPGLQQGCRAATAARSRRLMGRTVAVAQMALSLVLVAGACLFAFSLHQLREFDTGVRRDRLLFVEVNSSDAGYKNAAAIALNTRLRERLAAVPGVTAVTFSQDGIYIGRSYSTHIDADGFSGGDPRNHHFFLDHVGPYFFTTAGARMLAGRDFTDRDDAGAPKVAIVSSALARRVFEGREPLGQNLYVATGKGTSITYQVIGVVQDIRNDVRRPQPMFYLSQLQTQATGFNPLFLVRTGMDFAGVIPALRTAVRAEDSALRVEQVHSAWEMFDRTLATDRLMALLAWGFGVLAMVLAAVGIYGLLSYEVTRRTGEIGIRMAVGAQKVDVIALVMREVALICGVGLLLGSAAALAMARLVEGMVFQMRPGNPLVEGAASVLLAAVAMAAAWIPARRASRMDPMAALRNE